MSPAEKVAEARRNSKDKAHFGFQQVWECCAKNLRTSLDLTLADVSIGAGVSLGSINALEAGRSIGFVNAYRIAKFFGKPIEEIWTKLLMDDPAE